MALVKELELAEEARAIRDRWTADTSVETYDDV